MKNKLIAGLVFVAVFLIIVFVATLYKLNSDILFTAHKQIDISLGQEYKDEDILNILKEVVGDRKVKVQKLEVYEDMVSISIKEISDEELENLNNKINEKYNQENKVEDLKVTEIPKVKFSDYINPYIKPFFIALTLIVVYVGIYVFIKIKKK